MFGDIFLRFLASFNKVVLVTGICFNKNLPIRIDDPSIIDSELIDKLWDDLTSEGGLPDITSLTVLIKIHFYTLAPIIEIPKNLYLHILKLTFFLLTINRVAADLIIC